MSDLKIEAVYSDQGFFMYHDIVLENGKLVLSESIDEIKNRLIVGLQTYLGENWTDTTYGTDYHNNIFGRDTDDTVVIDEIKSRILQTRGVTGLKTFVIDPPDSNRSATVTAQVLTTQGEINLTTPIQT